MVPGDGFCIWYKQKRKRENKMLFADVSSQRSLVLFGMDLYFTFSNLQKLSLKVTVFLHH